jgi:hypothetical protein
MQKYHMRQTMVLYMVIKIICRKVVAYLNCLENLEMIRRKTTMWITMGGKFIANKTGIFL